jgi:hypothetical protein
MDDVARKKVIAACCLGTFRSIVKEGRLWGSPFRRRLFSRIIPIGMRRRPATRGMGRMIYEMIPM